MGQLMLKKVKILLIFIKHILRHVYIFLKDIEGFFSCVISRFNISRFTDLKFFKKIIRDSLSLENKANPAISFQTKPGASLKTTQETMPKTEPVNYGDLAYEKIIMNFDKLGFSGSAFIGSTHIGSTHIVSKPMEFIKDNLNLLEKDRIINEADLVCAHEFNLLGSGRVKVEHFLKAAGVEGFVYNNRFTDDEIRVLKDKFYREIRTMMELRQWTDPMNLLTGMLILNPGTDGTAVPGIKK
jgi:hypothetical protein